MSINSNNKEHGSPRSNSDVSRRNWGRLLACLIAAGLACSAAGCVDSENEVLFRAPLLLECESLDPVSIKSEGYKEAPALADVFHVNLFEASQGMQIAGWDPDFATDPVTNEKIGSWVAAKDLQGVEFSGGVFNTLGPTTNYTKIGIGSEMRVDQNGVSFSVMEMEIEEAPDDFPSDLVIDNKPVSLHLGSATSTARPGFILLSRDEAITWNDALNGAGLTGIPIRLTIGMQLVGRLLSGYPISSTKIYMPVIVCAGAALSDCGFETTHLCSSSK